MAVISGTLGALALAAKLGTQVNQLQSRVTKRTQFCKLAALACGAFALYSAYRAYEGDKRWLGGAAAGALLAHDYRRAASQFSRLGPNKETLVLLSKGAGSSLYHVDASRLKRLTHDFIYQHCFVLGHVRGLAAQLLRF